MKKHLGIALLAPAVVALWCTSCTGTIVATHRPHEPHAPVVVEDRHPGHGSMARLGIPPGHLPPPGGCRIWFPGKPPGHQPRPGNCSSLRQQLPAGAWLVHRPSQGRDYVIVDVCHDRRPDFVVAIRTYEAASGRFVSERRP